MLFIICPQWLLLLTLVSIGSSLWLCWCVFDKVLVQLISKGVKAFFFYLLLTVGPKCPSDTCKWCIMSCIAFIYSIRTISSSSFVYSVQTLGRDSIQEYNKNHQTQLSFVHVIKALASNTISKSMQLMFQRSLMQLCMPWESSKNCFLSFLHFIIRGFDGGS